jgi:hypothetical protein
MSGCKQVHTQKLKKSTTNFGNIFGALLFCTLLSCETTKQNDASVTTLGYSQLDQNNPKDHKFFQALSKSLEKLGFLIAVSAETQELNQYREGKRPYPTNYLYTIKPSPNTKVSLEEIKHANLSLR